MKRRLGLVLLVLLGGAASAGAECSVSVTPLAFGIYTGTMSQTVASVTISCGNSRSVQIGLNAGTGASATENTREMTGPNGATLNYEMFQDSTRSANWGNTTGTVSGKFHSQTNLNIYAQAAAGQLVVPGTYTDTITVLVDNQAAVTFTVTAIVANGCSISASPLVFGAYSGALLNSTSTISATCTNTTPYNLGLDSGTATGATVTNRSMTGPSSTLLHYNLFSNSGQNTNWGNTVGTDTVPRTATGTAQTLIVYGQVPGGQYVRPGGYSDTITVTLTY